MSRLDHINYEIEQLFIEGFGPKGIAAQLGIPLELIYDWLEANSLEDEDGCGPDLVQDELSPYSTINS